MGLTHGGKIVTDGLVLALDAGNIKSFPGEPTTNYGYNVGGRPDSVYLADNITWINSGAFTLNTNETDISKPIINGLNTSNLRIISGVVTTVGSIHFGCAFTTISPSTTYNVSVYYRQNSINATSPYIRTNINNSSIGTLSYNGSTNTTTWPVNEWIRISAIGTTQSNENGLYISNYIGTTVGEKIWYFGYQIEQKTYPTNLVAGTRGTTVATGGGLKDLSGNINHGELVNGPTYSSLNGGSISFDGTNDYVKILNNSSINFGSITNFTYSFWIKSTQNTLYAGLIGKVAGGNYGYDINLSNGKIITEFRVNTIFHGMDVSSTFLSNGGWWNIVVVFNRTSYYQVYVNSVLDVQTNISTFTGTIDNSGDLFIGGSVPGSITNYLGLMTVVTLHNKALSASEISQNFNATKGRFGL